MADETFELPAVSGSDRAFLFPGLALGGPAEELMAVAQRRLRMYWSLGDKANAERLSEALELAKARLAAVLPHPDTTTGS